MNIFAKWRYRPLLNHIVAKLEDLYVKSKIKAAERVAAELAGNKSLADELSNELNSEGVIFYAMRNALSAFCDDHNLKDPFAA